MKDRLHRYFNQRVELRAHGFSYRGRLAGADEEFIYLVGLMGWIVLPLPAVTSIKAEGSAEQARDYREVPGEPAAAEAEREAKRRYSPRDLRRVHEPDEENEPPD